MILIILWISGTTLNLLKFPIVDPTQWRLALRAQRLLKVKTAAQEEKKLQKSLLKDTRKLQYASLMGKVTEAFNMLSCMCIKYVVPKVNLLKLLS